MRSDGALLDVPLQRSTCSSCGTGRLDDPPKESAVRALFRDEYALYAHASDDTFEKLRQRAYAGWISSLLPSSFSAEALLEIGCGNGSLLTELAAVYPGSQRRGIEPVVAAAEHARGAGHDVLCAYFDEAAGARLGNRHDLVISVNVLEHVPDPESFLTGLAATMAPEAYAVVICPDGETPSVELLMHDHLHSFTARGLREIAGRAGLVETKHATAPDSIGAFQASVFRWAAVHVSTAPTGSDPCEVHESRRSFLEAWKNLDDELIQMCGSDVIVCFGIGETANLLRVYAPRVWSRIGRFVADGAAPGELDGRKVTPYGSTPGRPGERYLLAVRTQAQERVAARISNDGNDPIRWDHIATT